LDEELECHQLLVKPIVGLAAARQAWDFYSQARQVETCSQWREQRSSRQTHVCEKCAQVGRNLAASMWLGGNSVEAERLLQDCFELAVEAKGDQLQHLILSDAAEIRAKHAEQLSPCVAPLEVFAFAVEQYAEYCRALELYRAASASSGCNPRLAKLELKVGVHLLQFANVQNHLLDAPVSASLPVAVEAYGGALAGVGSSSVAWLNRMKSMTIVELALKHLQRALLLFEGNGEETAAVHFQLAEAYAFQLERLGASGGEAACSTRRAAALRHIERAAAGFEADGHWHDVVVSHRRRIELNCCPAAENFRSLTEVERKLPVDAIDAIQELRQAMGDLVRTRLQYAKVQGAEESAGALRELYRIILRGEALPTYAANTLDSGTAAGSNSGKKRRTPKRG